MPPPPSPSSPGADESECYDEGWVVGEESGAGGEDVLRAWLGNRHSSTHGRAIGAGEPLRGTSWLNRPYEWSFEAGSFIMTGDPADGVSSANDVFAAISAGWDWDHYWGGQLRVGWTTPELTNSALTSDTGDNLFMGDMSVMFYPWGDSRKRPYLRVGAGLTELEFTNAASQRRQETLYTLPIAIGIKYQFRRWAAWRAEFANNIAFGSGDANTVNNITLTVGVEGRFGGRPS
ncbi:MAG: outer membrane beta-barrel protein, partial [Planctomycetota bacterium]